MAPDRTPYIAANWKMNKTIEETEAFLGQFLPKAPSDRPEVVICPPFLALKAAVELCAQSRVRVAAQNMHEDSAGAFTGASISASTPGSCLPSSSSSDAPPPVESQSTRSASPNC